MRHLLVMKSCVLFVLLAMPSIAVGSTTPQDTTARDTTERQTNIRFTLPEILVSGSHVPAERRSLGFASSVITDEELARRPVQYAAEALSRTASLWIDEGAGVFGPTSIRLRAGDEAFTQVLIDGVPINLTGGALDLQGLGVTNINRIEVARGTQSPLHGSAAMAGVVQMISPRGQPGSPRWTLTAEGGTAAREGSNFGGTISTSGGTSVLQYSAGAGYTYNRGFYDLPHDLSTIDAAIRLDAQPSSDLLVTGNFRYMNIESNLPVRDPGVTRAPLDPNQRDGRNRIITSLRTQLDVTPSWRNEVIGGLYVDDFFYVDEFDGLDPGNFPFFVFDANFRLDSRLLRGFAEYTGTNTWDTNGPSRATLSYGVRLEHEDLNTDQTGDFGDAIGAFDRTSQAGFAELQGRLGDRVDFLAGARVEKLTDIEAEFVPRVSLVISLAGEAFGIRGSAGRAFKAPNLQQQFLENPFTIPNPDLRPETSWGWEAGIVSSANDRLALGAGFFYQRYQDLIRTVPVAGTTMATNVNVGESRVRGVELDVEYLIASNLRTYARMTYQDGTIVDNTGLDPTLFGVGDPLIAVPDFTATLLADGDVTETFGGSFKIDMVSSRDVLSERFFGTRETLDAYALIGASIHVRPMAWATVYAKVNNLLNVDYMSAFDMPGRPLTVAVGTRIAR